MIAGAHSNSGKSTITMGILLELKRMGMDPQSFKAGPDFLDPMHHTMVLNKSCRNLDTWMFPGGVRDAFVKGAKDSGISVIEGVMGLYDGMDGKNEEGSSAHLSKLLKTPVILVIDAHGMSRSAGAIAAGFVGYDRDVNIAGVIFNNVGSETHLNMLRDSLRGIPCFGGVMRSDVMHLESRHLGLVPAAETYDPERYERIREHVVSCVDIKAVIEAAKAAEPLESDTACESYARERVRIGVARDQAFNFYYIHNIEALEAAGAEIVP
ncbi:MAG: cobyrinate a,c-diamide synthase, partial [Candidatus Methanoplasma sp.]|nr:cobyrinate a,c-diamide synthase [Candidatus Methanoplasma sp.]